jgi:pentalenolactone synthase
MIQLPIEQPGPLQVPPLLRRLHAEGGIHRVRTEVDDEAWLVTGYELVHKLLADKRLGLSHPEPDKAPRSGASALFGGPVANYDTEEADHDTMRRAVQPQFSPAHMQAFRPRVEELVTGVLDELAAHGSPADLHEVVAMRLPIRVLCELIGVPVADRDQFSVWCEEAGDIRDTARSMQGAGRLFAYSQQLVARRRAEPADDFISRLCANDEISDELVVRFATFIVFSGHATTAMAIGWGALCLLDNPDQRQAVIDNPDLLAAMVEETLRLPSIDASICPHRYAHVDIDIAGVTIREGDLVLMHTSAANHDARVFPDSDKFDVCRSGSPHVAFGHGSHYCLGAPLVRLQLQLVFSQMLARFPQMRLAIPFEELQLRTDTLAAGLAALPVEW